MGRPSSTRSRGNGSLARRLATGIAAVVLTSSAIAPAVMAGDPIVVTNTTVQLVAGGSQSFPTPAAAPLDSATSPAAVEVSPASREGEATPKRIRAGFAAPQIVAGIPNPFPNPVVNRNPGFFGFNGVSHADQRLANGGNQFSTEPPDQGLCVGNGFVMDAVNTALAVYDANGSLRAGPTDLNTFFGYPAEIDRTTGIVGPSLGDPKCYYDVSINRWFVTSLTFDTDGVTTRVDIAVSQTGDPTGTWSTFSLLTTNDGTNGTPVHPNCPCFGDQPLIGADANAFVISTNEYSVEPFGAFFNGAQVYAISKSRLAAAAGGGGATPPAVLIDAGAIPTPDDGGIWYTLQPATSPGRSFERSNGGTEYFLSALDFFNLGDNRIAAWALTNTRSLNGPSPSLSLANDVIRSEQYAPPPPASQKAGPIPLGDQLGEPEETIDSNDDRMNQVVFAGGLLYSGVNTAVGAGDRVGAAYFIVAPQWRRAAFNARVIFDGYVSIRNENVLFPSIGVNDFGVAVMSFSISGPDYFPSTGYARILGPIVGPVHVAGAGASPEDGFTGYAAFDGDGTSRWGDYSAAVADSQGNIWIAAEFIPGTPRTVNANWGTFVGRVSPFGL
jgi:hypothetical protein